MRILTIDIGTGTQDILLFDSDGPVENGAQLVMPAPTQIVAQKVRAATQARAPLALTGAIMGGGPCHWAVEDHLRAGLAVYSTPAAAATFNDDLDWVQREMGVQLASWAPPLPHAQLAERLRDADIFVLPSIEEGMARTISEAMACGLPVVVTHNTGTADLVEAGASGTIVPIRDAGAITEALRFWAEKVRTRETPPERRLDTAVLSFDRFSRDFIDQLRSRNLI